MDNHKSGASIESKSSFGNNENRQYIHQPSSPKPPVYTSHKFEFGNKLREINLYIGWEMNEYKVYNGN